MYFVFLEKIMTEHVNVSTIVAPPDSQNNAAVFMKILKVLLRERWRIELTTRYPCFVYYGGTPQSDRPADLTVLSGQRTDRSTADTFTNDFRFNHYTAYDIEEFGTWIRIRLFDNLTRTQRAFSIPVGAISSIFAASGIGEYQQKVMFRNAGPEHEMDATLNVFRLTNTELFSIFPKPFTNTGEESKGYRQLSSCYDTGVELHSVSSMRGLSLLAANRYLTLDWQFSPKLCEIAGMSDPVVVAIDTRTHRFLNISLLE